jgi:KDO2-lipid IV(A) lauroyltransferase
LRLIALANRLNVTYWAIRTLSRIVQALPLSVGYALAAALADLVFGSWPSIRQRTTANFAVVVGSADAPRLAAASFRHYFRYLVEFLRFPALDRSAIERAVDVRGVEHLHGAMAAGRGAIAVGFHIGNIDLGAAVLAQVGYPVNVVVDTFEPPKLDELIQREREAKGLKLIPLELAPRRALRVLRSKEILALLVDKPTPEDGVVVHFFGGHIAIPAGAAFLALRTGASIVPCCVFRTGGGRFVAEVASPINPTGYADVEALTQAMVDTLEVWVRRHPEQWYPFRTMFLDGAKQMSFRGAQRRGTPTVQGATSAGGDNHGRGSSLRSE